MTEESEGNPMRGASDSWLPEFSNCFEPAAPIVIDNQLYASTEHYYQARKFRDPISINRVLSQDSPIRAKFAANKLSNKVKKKEMMKEAWKPGTYIEGRPIHMIPEKEWNEMKEAVMFEATFAKYRQHKKLRQLLLSTKDRELIEPNINDEYWGCGKNGCGQNRLGFVLMQVRRVLLAEQQDSPM